MSVDVSLTDFRAIHIVLPNALQARAVTLAA